MFYNNRPDYYPESVSIHGEDDLVEDIVEQAEMMGYSMEELEYNPELMGGLLKKIFKKIQARIRAKRAARAGSGASEDFSFTTPSGTGSVGPGGMRYANAMPMQAMPAQTGGISGLMQNPMALGGIALVAILLLKKKK